MQSTYGNKGFEYLMAIVTFKLRLDAQDTSVTVCCNMIPGPPFFLRPVPKGLTPESWGSGVFGIRDPGSGDGVEKLMGN